MSALAIAGASGFVGCGLMAGLPAGQFDELRIPAVPAAFRVHPALLTFRRTSEQRAAEPVVIVESHFESPSLPPHMVPWRAQAFRDANLVDAQLHLRAGRFRSAYQRLRTAGSLFPHNVSGAVAIFSCYGSLGIALIAMFAATAAIIRTVSFGLQRCDNSYLSPVSGPAMVSALSQFIFRRPRTEYLGVRLPGRETLFVLAQMVARP